MRVRLILSHYSMNLMPAFLIEGCLAIFIQNEVLTDEYFHGKPIAMPPFLDIIKIYHDLFRNEHFMDLNIQKKRLLDRVGYFVKKGYWTVANDEVTVVNKERTVLILGFFSDLIRPLVDTYLITLSAIEQICGKNLVLKEKKLIKELHVCIKRLYTLKVIPHLVSCLKEIIATAL